MNNRLVWRFLSLFVLTLVAIGPRCGETAEFNGYGICTHLNARNHPTETVEAERICRTLGADGFGTIRVGFSWGAMQEKQGGDFNFSQFDRIFAAAEKGGVRVLPLLTGAPGWARPVWKNLDGWKAYVKAFVGRYAGRISMVEVWNEQNTKGFWKQPRQVGTREDPYVDDYVELLKATYETVKAIDTNIRVAVGGFSGVPMNYIRKLYKVGGNRYFEVMNVHPYSRPLPPEGSFDTRLEELRAFMDANGDGAKPIRVSEVGWPTHCVRPEHPELLAEGLKAVNADKKTWRIAYAQYAEGVDDPDGSMIKTLEAALPEGSRIVTLEDEALIKALEGDAVDAVLMPLMPDYRTEAIESIKAFVKRGGTLLWFGKRFTRPQHKTAEGYIVAHDDFDRGAFNSFFRFGMKDRKSDFKAAVISQNGLKEGDRFIPLREVADKDGKKLSTAAVIRYASDLKGAIVISGYDESTGGTSEELQARYLVRMAAMASALGVDNLEYYDLLALESDAFESERHYGLWHADFTPKPAYRAYVEYIRRRPVGSKNFSGQHWKTADGVGYFPKWQLPGGGMAGLLWKRGRTIERELKLDGNVGFFDIYGTPLKFPQTENGYRVKVGEDPIYWQSVKHVEMFKIGPDEPAVVKAAVKELEKAIYERTGEKVVYSTFSSPLAGDIFVSTQPWAAKGAWFVKEKNSILAVHGSDFEGTAAAVRALTARYLKSEDGRIIRGKTDYTMASGVQREQTFAEELKRVEAERKGAEDWENELVTERNREQARAYSFPLERVEDAFVPELPKTKYVKSLDGKWKFNWCGKPADRPRDFFGVGFDDSDWYEMDVPACVECRGFGVPIFTNIPYYNLKEPPKTDPMYNPVSSYRTTFSVPADWDGRRIHLRFEGVASAFNVWVNGRRVGYGEDSMLPSEFDITDFVAAKGAANVLAVEVFRWSDGSYLEDQDRFEFSGIHRSVSIWGEPKEGIRDFRVETHCDGRLEVECGGASWKLYDADFKEVAVPVKDVRLWSAEQPYLYTLVMTKGEDIRSTKVGFREIALSGSGAILVNGRPVKMRGVNWREFSASEGFTVTEAEMEEDIRLLKRGNFNCVRTCHNPGLPYFYHLCDRYGIYVQSEANVESHGMRYGVKSLGHPPSWAKSHVERGARMVANYRNFPCVFQWSLGNEAGTGPVFERMRDAMLALDNTRLYINRNDNENFVIHGHGYLTMAQLERAAAWGPFFLSEYAHCMGNSMGNFAEYWDMFYRYDTLQGGCIWDWIDQVVPVKTDRIGPDGKRIVYGGYGGDWDEGSHHAAGCVNGLLGPERKENAKFAEAAHVQRFLIVRCEDAAAGEATIENRHSFTFADEYEGVWELQVDGVRVDGGSLEVPHVAPLESGKITLPRPRTTMLGTEAFYRVAFKLKDDCFWAKRGFEVAHDQLPYRIDAREAKAASASANLEVEERVDSIVVKGGRTEAVFSKATGTLSLLRMDGKTVLADEQGICRGPRLTCMRAYRDGDLWMKKGLMASGMTRLEYHVRPAKMVRASNGEVKIESKVEVEGASGVGFTHQATYEFSGDGLVIVRNTVIPKGRLPALMRLGLTCLFDERLERVDYYGRGPWENYVDRKSACDISIWSTTVTEMFEPYVRPQDCGYRSDVRWAAFLDAAGDGVLVKASEPMFMSALHYGWEELALARHTSPNVERVFAPVYPRKEVVANFDLRQMGLGNAQCGPKPFAGYAFKPQREEWTVTFKPVKGAAGMTKIAAEVPQVIPQRKEIDVRPVGMGYDGG